MNEEQMAAWMAVSGPAEEHEFLKKMEGTWNAKTTFWMDPSADPMVSEGKMEGELILGGRFLVSKYSGETPWGPFEGMAIDGYDRIRKHYTGLWIDSMGTPMMTFTGSVDGNVRTMTSKMACPTGDESDYKGVTTIVSDTEYKYESFQVKDGNEFRSMEIVYTK